MKPLITVIMPVYNASKYMRESIESVIVQSYKNWNLILIDDGSTDESISIIEEYCKKDQRIRKILLKHNGGVANARNEGIALAEGDYIAFLDSDDLWKPDKLQIQVDYILQTGCKFVYSAYDVINEQGEYLKTITPYWSKVGYEQLLNTNIIACCTIVVESGIMKKDPMPQLKHEDYATWLNILKHNQIEAQQVPGVLAAYRKVKGSVSSNKFQTIAWNWNIYRNNQKLGFVRSLKQIITFICMTGYKYVKR